MAPRVCEMAEESFADVADQLVLLIPEQATVRRLTGESRIE